MVATILQMTELESMIQDMSAQQESILLARKYFQGDQVVYLTSRAQEFLGIHSSNTFRLNICRTVVTALSEELNLLGFDTSEPKTKDGKRPVAEWAAEVFEKNKLDSLQDGVHEDAFSDSESFVLVEWDELEQYPRMIPHPRFIDTDVYLENSSATGDGFGIFAVYENDDPNQRMIAAVKQWIETTFEGALPISNRRRTIYYPDRVERWIWNGGAWVHFLDGVNDWTIPQIDSDGKPLGIPVFHFKNKGLRPEHWDAIPMQDATNKQLVDALAAGDLTAFQSFFGFGFYPTIDGKEPKEDGSNLMKMGPAQFNGTMKPADQASLTVIPGADVTPIFNGLKDIILYTSMITETPASRFVVTAQVASDKTIKQQDRQLKKKAGDRRGLFSDPWVGAFNMARKLANIFGGAGLDEEIPFSPIWDHTETLEELAEKKTAIEIPIEQLWREAGYDDEQIEKMRKDPSYRVKFEAELWEGYNAASQHGIPLETYLKRVGVPDEEIEELVKAIENQSGVPTENL